MLNTGDVGDVGDVIAVAVPADNRLAVAGDGRSAPRQNSWKLHISISSSNKPAEMINRIVRLPYYLLHDVIKKDLIRVALWGREKVESISKLVVWRSIVPVPGNLVSALLQSCTEPYIIYMSKPPTTTSTPRNPAPDL
jgi:hypothetical protein